MTWPDVAALVVVTAGICWVLWLAAGRS